jgi:hypothetical protein
VIVAQEAVVGFDCRGATVRRWRRLSRGLAVDRGLVCVRERCGGDSFQRSSRDGGVVDEAIDDGEGHRRVGEDLAPFAEWLVGGDKQGSPLVPGADQSLVSA